MSLKYLFLFIAGVCFFLGAIGVSASINWDLAGKTALVAVLATW